MKKLGRPVVDWEEMIYERTRYVVVRTACREVLKIRKDYGTRISPGVAIRYYRYLASKIGRKYVVEKRAVEIDRDSKLMLEKIVGKRMCRAGILMEDMASGCYAKLRLGWAEAFVQAAGKRCSCHFCFRTKNRYEHCAKDLFDGKVHEVLTEFLRKGTRDLEVCSGPIDQQELIQIVSAILSKEPLLQKVKQLQHTYDRFGPLKLRWLYEKYFGCYMLRAKKVGLKPFVLKGNWTKEKAEEFFYSYKTAMALRDITVFIRLFPDEDTRRAPELSSVEHSGRRVYYEIKITKIDLRSKSRLDYYATQYKHLSHPIRRAGDKPERAAQ